MACRISLLRKREKTRFSWVLFFSQEKKDSELCGLDSELGSLEKGKLLLGKKIKQERDGNYNIQGADSRFILSEWRVLCLEFLKARVDLHYVCIVSSYDPIFVMLSTIPYTALPSPTPIFSSSSIAVLMFWPWPPMHVDAHTTLYTLHSIPYTALLGPIPIFFEFFQCFSYVLTLAPNARQGTDHTLYYTLSTLPPPTFTLQTPVLNLTPIFSSYSSSSIAFLLFWPPQMHVHARTRGESNPTVTQFATWYIGRKTDHGGHPKWLVNCLKLAGFGTLPPRPPILTSFAMSNFSQAWQLAFVIYIYIYIYRYTHFSIHMYISTLSIHILYYIYYIALH